MKKFIFFIKLWGVLLKGKIAHTKIKDRGIKRESQKKENARNTTEMKMWQCRCFDITKDRKLDSPSRLKTLSNHILLDLATIIEHIVRKRAPTLAPRAAWRSLGSSSLEQ